MTDLHCHILFGIDDGPTSIEQSLALVQMATNNNIEKIVLTPHVMKLDLVDEFVAERNKKIDMLRILLSQYDISVELFPGAEVLVNDDIFYAPDFSELTLNRSRYLLTEFQYSNISENRFVKYIEELTARGLVPIIAHPERYQYFQRDYEFAQYVSTLGVLFQVNADALCGLAGRTEAKLSKWMVKNSLVSFIATDAHSIDHRPNNLLEMITAYLHDIDPELMSRLVNENPEAVLNNKPIPSTPYT